MNGVKYELTKLAEQIDQMLINPRQQTSQHIFDINFYSFTHKCLHTIQILLNCLDLDESIKNAYNKVAKAMKQAAKCRPQQDVQQQDIGGKDQISIFLNTRKPIAIQEKDRGQLYKFLANRQMKEKDNQTFLSSINKIRNIVKPLSPPKILSGQLSTQTQISWVRKIQIETHNQKQFDYQHFKQQFQSISQKFSGQQEGKAKKQGKVAIQNKKQKSETHLNKSQKSLQNKNKLQLQKQIKQTIENSNGSSGIIQNTKPKTNLKSSQKHKQKQKHRTKNKGIQQEMSKIQSVQLSKALDDSNDFLVQDTTLHTREIKMPSIETKQHQANQKFDNILIKEENISDQNIKNQQCKRKSLTKIQRDPYRQNSNIGNKNFQARQIQKDSQLNAQMNSQMLSNQHPKKSQIQQKLKHQLLSFCQQQNQQLIIYENQAKKSEGKNYQTKQSKVQSKENIRQSSRLKLKIPIKSEKNQIIYQQQGQNEQHQNEKNYNLFDINEQLQKESNIKDQLYAEQQQARFSLKPSQNPNFTFKNQNKKRSNTEDKSTSKDEEIQKNINTSAFNDKKKFNQYESSNLPYINTSFNATTKHQSFHEQTSKISRKLKIQNKQNINRLTKSTHHDNLKKIFQKVSCNQNIQQIYQSRQFKPKENQKIRIIKDKINLFLSKAQVQKQQFFQNQKQLILILEKLKKGLNQKHYDSESASIIKKYSKQVGECVRMIQLIHQKACGKKCKHLQRFYAFAKSFKIYGKQQLKISTYIVGNNFEP